MRDHHMTRIWGTAGAEGRAGPAGAAPGFARSDAEAEAKYRSGAQTSPHGSAISVSRAEEEGSG